MVFLQYIARIWAYAPVLVHKPYLLCVNSTFFMHFDTMGIFYKFLLLALLFEINYRPYVL